MKTTAEPGDRIEQRLAQNAARRVALRRSGQRSAPDALGSRHLGVPDRVNPGL